jgi:hypothetical protein
MTVTLNLPPEKEAAFKAQAQARGIPVLSDEAMSRESIYPDLT